MITIDMLTSLPTFFRNDGARKIQKYLFCSQSTCLIIKTQTVPELETLIFSGLNNKLATRRGNVCDDKKKKKA